MEQFFTKSSVLEAKKRAGVHFPSYKMTMESVVKDRLRSIAKKFHPNAGRDANPYILQTLIAKPVAATEIVHLMERDGDSEGWIGFQGLHEQYDIAVVDIPKFVECYWIAWPERADNYGFYLGNCCLTVIGRSTGEGKLCVATDPQAAS